MGVRRAAVQAGAWFSVTARMNPAVTAAITGIADHAWTSIRYPNAVWEDDDARPEPSHWVSGLITIEQEPPWAHGYARRFGCGCDGWSGRVMLVWSVVVDPEHPVVPTSL